MSWKSGLQRILKGPDMEESWGVVGRGGNNTEKRPLNLEQTYFIDYLKKQLNIMRIAVELKKKVNKERRGIVGRRHASCWINLAVNEKEYSAIRMGGRFKFLLILICMYRARGEGADNRQ